MAMKTILVTVLSIGMLSTVSGCGTVAGAAGSAIAGQAASGMLASGGNKARFSRQSCDELEREIAGAQRSMMNPANIIYARSYIKDARTAAIDKNCPFVQAEAAAETETESDQES